MFMRTPFEPALSSSSITAWSREAGPSVARIFALPILSRFKPGSLTAEHLIQARNDGRHVSRVVFKLFPKSTTQQFFLATHSNYRANQEDDQRRKQRYPVAHRQTGSHDRQPAGCQC